VQLPHPVQVLLRTLQDAGREPRERAITPMVEREERHEEV
jgi:hypothetical protein